MLYFSRDTTLGASLCLQQGQATKQIFEIFRIDAQTG